MRATGSFRAHRLPWRRADRGRALRSLTTRTGVSNRYRSGSPVAEHPHPPDRPRSGEDTRRLAREHPPDERRSREEQLTVGQRRRLLTEVDDERERPAPDVRGRGPAQHEARRIEVSVENGVVTLTGPVDSFAEKRAVMGVVSHLPGVLAVCDRLMLPS